MRLLGWLALLLVAAPAAAADLEWSLRFLNRFHYLHDQIETQLVLDAETRRFRAADYLVPSLEQYLSTHTIGLTLDASLGRGFGLVANLDSGALRVGSQYQTFTVPVPVGRRTLPVTFPVSTTEVLFTANGSTLGDEARRTFFLRELYGTYGSPSALSAYWGKRRMTLADGFLYDQFTFAAGLRAGSKPRDGRGWRFELDAMVADGSFDSGGKASPLLHVGVSYLPGPMQHLGFMVVFFHDGNDILSEVFRTSMLEASIDRANAGVRTPLLAVQVPFSSRGNLVWFGFTGRRFLGDHIFSGLLLGQAGRVRASTLLPQPYGGAPVFVDLDAAAYGLLADLHYRYDVTEDLGVGGFFMFATGDSNLAEGFRRGTHVDSLNTFISLFPFVNRANLFFTGGLNAELTQRRAATLGVNARGVMAAGAFARWDTRTTSLEGRVVALGAPAASLYDGRFYGVEVDLVATRRLWRYVRAVGELDVLATGSFFGAQRAVVQLILGIDVVLP